MSLQANYGYVVLEPIKEPSVTPGGVHLPEKTLSEDRPITKGLVLSVNDDDYAEFAEGDVVHFNRYSCLWAHHNNKKYLVVKTEDVLAFEVEDE